MDSNIQPQQPIQNEAPVVQSYISQPQAPKHSFFKNKWLWLIIIFVVFGILFLSTYYLLPKKQNSPINQNINITCEKIKYVHDDKNINCLIELAKKTKDSSLCEKIKNDVNSITPAGSSNSTVEKFTVGDVMAEDCYAKVGGYLGDLSMCDRIKFVPFEKDECYGGVAKTKKDPSVCKLTSKDYADHCLEYVGITMESLSVCDQVKSDSGKAFCYGSVAKKTKDISICAKLNFAGFQQGCYSFFAKENKDYKLCLKISPDDLCLQDVAGLTGDISICKYVKKYPVFCYAAIAIYKNDSRICNQYSDDVDLCISVFAIAKNRIDLCPSIQESFHRNDCYADITSKLEDKGDPNACGKITDDNYSKDSCYTNLAIDKKAPELCNYVLETGEKNFCLNRTGALTANLNVCDKISINENSSDPFHVDQQMKDQCYADVGAAKKDKSICQQIINDDYQKTSCLTNIERGITSFFQPTITPSAKSN